MRELLHSDNVWHYIVSVFLNKFVNVNDKNMISNQNGPACPVSGRQKQLQIEPTLDGKISNATVRKDGKAITLCNFKGYPKYSKEFINSEIELWRKNIEH